MKAFLEDAAEEMLNMPPLRFWVCFWIAYLSAAMSPFFP